MGLGHTITTGAASVPPTPAQQRLRGQIADFAIALLDGAAETGSTRSADTKLIVNTDNLRRLQQLRAALAALESAEGP